MGFGLSRILFRGAALSLAVCIVGCNEADKSPTEPRTSETPTSVVPPSPSPVPPSTPSPSASPTPSPNHAPIVAINGGGSCYPRNCEIAFQADGWDEDGDPLSYSWSGCASGTKQKAVCRVDGVGEFKATVQVTDGRGGHVAASGTARGLNSAPRIGDWGFPTPLPQGSSTDGVGSFNDEDQCGVDIRTEFSGACSKVVTICTTSPFGGPSTFAALDFTVRTTAGPGECRVKLTFRDRWGAVTVSETAFPVAR